MKYVRAFGRPWRMGSKSVMHAPFASLIILVILGSVVVQSQGPSSDVVSDPEAYRVYAALVPKLSPVRNGHATNLVIQSEAFVFKPSPSSPDCFPSGLPTGTPLEADWPSVTDR